MKEYLNLMHGFGQTELRGYLGNDVVDLLIEWMPNGDNLLTRQRMISMIDSLYGTTILKKKEFRKDLLVQMPTKQIREIQRECLSGNEATENEINKVVNHISEKAWAKNRISLYLARLWGVPETVFEREHDDSITINEITAPEEQFYELLDYQYLIKQRVLNILNSGNLQERLLVHMPTGTGKTKTSMHIITNYLNFSLKKNGLVIWVAHTTELLDQAYNTFTDVWSHLGDGRISAYKLWGNHTIEDTSNPLNGIVFCGLQKLMVIADGGGQLWERLRTDCRLIVFDEAHKAAATKTKSVIENLLRMPQGYENRALVGLTATPGRSTEDSYDNNLLTNMFGGKLISIDSEILNQVNWGRLRALNSVAETNIIRYFQERRILAKMSPERLEYQKDFSDSDLRVLKSELKDMGYGEVEFTKEQLTVLATNKNRNTAIIRRLRKLHEENVPTIVFACSLNHARMLSAMLTLESIPNSLVTGAMDDIDRKKAIDDFKDRESGVDIIINYEVLTTGFDAKNIKCVFITRPTKSIVLYSQMLGRGLRGPLMGGNEECLLIDIDDNLEAFDNETAFGHFDDYWRV